MQSTNVKHKSSVAHICHEKSITTLWIQMCIFSSFTLLYFMSQVVTQMHGTVSCTHWFMYRLLLNTLRPRQYGRRFADDTFKRIVLNENIRISIKISLKFVPKDPINNNPAFGNVVCKMTTTLFNLHCVKYFKIFTYVVWCEPGQSWCIRYFDSRKFHWCHRFPIQGPMNNIHTRGAFLWFHRSVTIMYSVDIWK